MNPLDDGVIFTKNLAKVYVTLSAKTGITQYRLAKESGVSQAQVSRIFHGERAISVPQMYAFADALGVDLQLIISAAEWATTKQRPEILTDNEAYTISQWFDLAAKDGWDFLAEGEVQADYARATPRTGEV